MAKTIAEAYEQWLGIPTCDQPPNYYVLLGLPLFETDPSKIRQAGDRVLEELSRHQSGSESELAAQVERQVHEALRCLLDVTEKATYDRYLKRKLAEAHGLWDADRPSNTVAAQNLRQQLLGALHYILAWIRWFWLVRFKLAASYRSFGWELYRNGRARDELPTLFAELDGVTEKLRRLYRAEQKLDHECRRWWEWPAFVLTKAYRLLARTWYSSRRSVLLRQLGRAAAEKDRLWEGLEEHQAEIVRIDRRKRQLENRLAELSRVEPGKVLSPKRAALLLVALVLLVLLLLSGFLRWLLVVIF